MKRKAAVLEPPQNMSRISFSGDLGDAWGERCYAEAGFEPEKAGNMKLENRIALVTGAGSSQRDLLLHQGGTGYHGGQGVGQDYQYDLHLRNVELLRSLP